MEAALLQARMANPAFAVPGAMDALMAPGKAVGAAGLPAKTAEAVTRLADGAAGVPDDVWQEAADHYDEQQLGALVLTIANVNLWNRLNVTTRQVAGQAW